MKATRRHPLRAFLIAPLVPLVLMWAVEPKTKLAELQTFLTLGAMFVYPPTLVIGAPAYKLLTARGPLRLRHVVTISTLMGVALMGYVMWKADDHLVQTMLGGLLGASAGLTFWLLWRGRTPSALEAERWPR